MGRELPAGRVTPADEMRGLLLDCERLLGNIRGQGASLARLPENMDRIAEMWPSLTARGVDLRPEAGRWETIQAQTHKHAAAIAGELRAACGFEVLRAKHGGDTSAWWWQLDRETAQRSTRRTRRTIVAVAVVILVLAGAVFALTRLFPSDPRQTRAGELLVAGQQKIDTSQDYRAALPYFQAAADATPGDAEPWLWIAISQQKLGNAAAAQDAFRQARAAAGNDLDFYLGRAPIFLEARSLTPARADLAAALQLDPKSPQAYYFLSTIDETEGHIAQAIQDLQHASDYAEARGETSLVAATRYRLAILMQRNQIGAPQSTVAP
jgi:cytochrome c-type biogenesis protein CcmH/NrfG